MKIISSIAAFLFAVLVLNAQKALENVWVPNRDVSHITRGDGKIFMSGGFDWFGTPYESGIAIFDSELAHDNSYSIGNYGARSSVSDGAGGWYTSLYGNITHIKADKTIEDLPFLFEGGGYSVNALEKADNILYVGGNFNTVNGAATRRYVAAIDLTTNTLTSWNPNPSSFVYALKAAGSVVYVGGSFSTIGGQTRSKIAAIDATTGLATSWNALVTTAIGYVYTIAVDASNVYFGGSFSNVASGSPTRRNFASVNATTGALTSFNPRPDDNVRVILLDGTTLYVAGDFTQIAGVTKSGLVALDVTTGSLTAFSTTFNSGMYANNSVYTLAIDGQKLFIGGDFLTINETERARLAVVDKTTGALEPMTGTTAIGGYVLTISISGGKLLAAGSLIGISGITNSLNCVALDEETGQGTDWIPEMPALPANAYIGGTYFHYQNNRVYYWQDLYYPGNDRKATLGALNSTDGAAVSTWSVTVEEISAWAFSDNALFLAGNFTEVNGVPREGFAAVDLVTGAVLPWTINHSLAFSDDEDINSMIVHNNVLYVGGVFAFTENGVERRNLAAWNATTGAIMSWAPVVTLGEYQSVKIGAIDNTHVYLIGNVMMRVDAVSGKLGGWGFELEDEWMNIYSMAIQGNSVFLAGSFSPGLIRADKATGEISGWQPDMEDVYYSEGSVHVVHVSATKLFVGGNFSYEIDGVNRYYFAAYLLPDFPDTPENQNLVVYNGISPNGDGKNEMFIIQDIHLMPDTKSNKVTIYNRWGDAVWEGTNYDNSTVVFDGTNNNGKDLSSGTYFYKIEFSSGQQSKTGYLSIKR